MKKPLQETEYAYAAARVRALEGRLVGRERLNELIEAKTTADVLAKLIEFGVLPPEETSSGAEETAAPAADDPMEAALLSVLREAYRDVEAAVPDAAVFRWFRYPYDCNNVKVAMKCRIREIRPDGMLFDFGTVPAEDVPDAVIASDYAAFPPAMAAAAPRAWAAYAKTADPCKIDAILDRACYEDMLANAGESRDPTLIGWLRAKIDLVNIMICVRIIRMKRGDVGLDFMKETLLLGGTLDANFFETAYAGGENELWRALRHTDYTAVAAAVGHTDGSLARIEACLDDHAMQLAREGSRTAFGAAVPAGYLLECETSVKNLRILWAGKNAALPAESIRERMRMSYV